MIWQGGSNHRIEGKMTIDRDGDGLEVPTTHLTIKRAQHAFRQGTPEGVSLAEALIADRRPEAAAKVVERCRPVDAMRSHETPTSSSVVPFEALDADLAAELGRQMRRFGLTFGDRAWDRMDLGITIEVIR